MGGRKSLFDYGYTKTRRLIKILPGLVFLINQFKAYSLPIDTALSPKNIFEHIKDVPGKNRVTEANNIYRYKSNMRKAAPAAAMAALDQLSSLAHGLHDRPLECAAFDMRADYYSVNRGYNNLSIEYYQDAIDLATANKLLFETGLYLHKMGMYYSTFKHNAQACRYFLRSQEIFNQIGYGKIHGINLYLGQVADFYYSLGDYENAKTNLEAALHYTNENRRDKINIINTIGLIYRNYKHFPQAISYFNSAKNLAVSIKDTLWTGIAAGNIGSVYFLQDQYQKALPYIETDYNTSIKYGELRNGTIALLRLIKINVDNKNFDKAALQLKTAKVFLDKNINDVLSSGQIITI